MKSLFLSHSHIDKDIARQIYLDLKEAGIRCWFDEAEIRPGESIIAKIEQAIDDMDYLGIILSNASVNSTWVLTELRMALSDEIMKDRIRVVGFLIGECILPGFLRDKKYIDFRERYSSALSELKDLLKGTPYNIEPPKQAVMANIVNQADEELWTRLGGRIDRQALDQRSTADLIRTLPVEAIEAAIIVFRDWSNRQYMPKRALIRIVEFAMKIDQSAAARLINKLEQIDFIRIQSANYMPSNYDDQIYAEGALYYLLPRLARRSRLFPHLLQLPLPDSLSLLLDHKDPVMVGSCEWKVMTNPSLWWHAINYGQPITASMFEDMAVLVLVARGNPPTTWLFSSNYDRHPKRLNKYMAPMDPTYEAETKGLIKSFSVPDFEHVHFSLAKFDDLNLLKD